jgi:hypothetical protein
MWKIISTFILTIFITACASLKIDPIKLSSTINHAIDVKNDTIEILGKIDQFNTSIDKPKVKNLIKNIEKVSDKIISLKGADNISIDNINSIIEEGRIVYLDTESLIKPHFSKLPAEIQSKLLLAKNDLENTYNTWKVVSTPNNIQAINEIIHTVQIIIPVIKTAIMLLV